jgi:hypothetical protein
MKRDGRDADEKVEVDCTRVNIGGDGREGEGGRDGDRAMGDGGLRRRGVTLIDCTSDGGGGANGLSEVASLRASSNGLTTSVSTMALTGSSKVPNIATAESSSDCGCGCEGWGVAVPEGTADADVE